MKFVKIYVEGQTEETFVRDVLTPHLSGIAVYPTPVLAKTKREKSGRAFKGGLTSYAKVRRDILRLLDPFHFRQIIPSLLYSIHRFQSAHSGLRET